MQQLTTELLKEELAILDFEPPSLPAGGGGRRGGGRFAQAATVMEIPYYLAMPGVVTLTVLNDKGATAATRTDTVKSKGIEFFRYDLRIDAANAPGFNGAASLRPGNYEAVLSLPNGKKVSRKFTLKAGEQTFQQFGEEPEEEF